MGLQSTQLCVQALPSGDLEALLQQHPEMLMTSGMGRAPSFNMAKLESMDLPDAVAAVVSCPPQIFLSIHPATGIMPIAIGVSFM